MLGRVITLHDGGADVEPDPALLEEAALLMGVTGCNTACTPAIHKSFFPDSAQQDLTRLRIRGCKEGQNEEGEEEQSNGCPTAAAE